MGKDSMIILRDEEQLLNIFIILAKDYGHKFLQSKFGHKVSSIYTHFNTSKNNAFWKTFLKKVKLRILSNFPCLHNVFYAVCILKSFNSNILGVVCSFFEFGRVSKWCIMEWVKMQ